MVKIQPALSKFNRFCASISGIGFLIIIFLTVYEVVVRYAFRMPTAWTLEISSYMLLTATFLSASYTLETGGHIKIDLIPTLLKPKPRKILAIIVNILGILFVTLWLWKSAVLAWDSFSLYWVSRTRLEVTLWPFYAVIPFGLFFLLFQYVILLVREIAGILPAPANNVEEEI
ncbi:MAG: TRAP transporter small permease subunit [Dehalococcoidia bacterium]